MPYQERRPAIRVTVAAPDAVVGTIVLSPVRDASGTTVDHLVTSSVGAGATLLFGQPGALRGRRLSELDDHRAAFMDELLGHVVETNDATVELALADRRMLVHLSASEHVLTITYARVDAYRTDVAADTDAERIARLRTMMAHTADGVAMYRPIRDPAGAVVDFVCLEMSDADPLLPADEQIGRQLLDLYPECRDNGTFDGYVGAVATGEPWAPDPILYERTGQRYAYRLVVNPIDGDIIVSWRDTLIDEEPAGSAATGESLTGRQVTILQAIGDGRSTADIAATLYLSPFTIRNEVRRILAKLGARTRAEAVSAALSQQLIAQHQPPT